MDNTRGIDTLQLYTDEYEMSHNILMKNHFVYSQYMDKIGSTQEKYFCNILYDENGKSTYQVDIKNGYVSIKASIPKYVSKSDDNTQLAKIDDLMSYTDDIKKKLLDIGIDTQPVNMNVSRIDITNNGEMEYKSTEYISMLKNMNVKRIKENGKSIFNTSAIWKNSNKAICIYDKENEKNNNIISNLLRNEIRFFHKTNIESALKIKTMYDLINNFDSVCNQARQYEIDNLFNKDNFEEMKNKESEKLSNLIDFILREKENQKYKNQNILNEVIKFYGIDNLIKQNDSIENIVNVFINKMSFENNQLMRNYKYNLKKQMEKLQLENMRFNKSENKILYANLYNECVDKLVA